MTSSWAGSRWIVAADSPQDATVGVHEMTGPATRPCTKGIILAGGSGTRLYPLTKVINKHLLPIAGKPMIYYPLTTLMLAGISEVLVITTPRQVSQFQELLEDGSQWGLRIDYAIQPQADGLAKAFLIGADFIRDDPVALILGDNLFHGQGLSDIVYGAAQSVREATIFAYKVNDPGAYGVITLNEKGRAIEIEEKPDNPKSHYAVPGFYFYGSDVVEYARSLNPSARGELEISDLNRIYLQRGTLDVQILRRGIAWFDAGTPRALHDTSAYIEAIESRQGVGVACPEEVAFQMGYIDEAQLENLIAAIGSSPYGDFLRHIIG